MEPILVVGAGPVGQTAALLLARWGVPSVVLDARPQRDPVGSKAIVQQRDVLDIWCAAGADRVAVEGLTWTTSRTFYGARELFVTRFADRGGSPLPAFVNISQTRTEEILDERIAATAGIDVRWDHEVVDLRQDALGVSVRCRTGEWIRGSHAIVCAGARGDALRDLLGVGFPGESFSDPFLICDIRTDLGDWRHERRFYFDPAWNPGRQVLVHPCPDSTYRIDWQLPPGYDAGAEALERRIRAIIGDRPYELLWRSVYRFHARLAERFTVGRVLLAGDVAHLVSPFGARGLNSGVQDAENAAWKIAYARRGWGAADRLLESYHTERHAAAAENLAVTSATMDFLMPRDEPAARHRTDTLRRALTDPTARPAVDSGRLAEPYWYPDSPLHTPDPTRPTPVRPARGDTLVPAPGVLVPDFPLPGVSGVSGVPGVPGVADVADVADVSGVSGVSGAAEVADVADVAGVSEMSGVAGATRFRQVVRDGLLVLMIDSPAGGLAALLAAVPGPVRVLELADIDPTGAGRRALGARAGECWLIRPDGHVAAILADPIAVPAAALRVLGFAADHVLAAAP